VHEIQVLMSEDMCGYIQINKRQSNFDAAAIKIAAKSFVG